MTVKEHFFDNTQRRIAFIASLCLFLSAIEYIIPKPLPFMRLGLANMPIIISLYVLRPKQLFFLVLLKVVGQAFITGTFLSYIFLFSLAGSFSSALVMFLFYKLFNTYISPVGISLIGSLSNAISQIIMSDLILFGEAARYIAPVLLISAIITGLALGFFTLRFIKTSKWFELIVNESSTCEVTNEISV